MKFIVRVKSHLDEAEEYEAEDIYDLIDQLLDEWVEGDADIPGVLAFLADHGHDLGITDADVDEGTDESLLQMAADAVRTLLHTEDSHGLERLALFLSAISGEYTIEGPSADATDKESEASDSEKAGDEGANKVEEDDKEDGDDDADDEDEEYEKKLDEDYDY